MLLIDEFSYALAMLVLNNIEKRRSFILLGRSCSFLKYFINIQNVNKLFTFRNTTNAFLHGTKTAWLIIDEQYNTYSNTNIAQKS